MNITTPATEAAKQWDGWGTALKPAVEDWWLLRKPLIGTVAANVERFGCGALNVDGCRIEHQDNVSRGASDLTKKSEGWQRPWMRNPEMLAASFARKAEAEERSNNLGRWPANLIHDGSEEVAGMFPVSDGRNPQGVKINTKTKYGTNIAKNCYGGFTESQTIGYSDSGSTSRFFKACPPDDAASLFYCAKASRSEREAGLEGSENKHPTVKSQSLMRYLCRLITPPNGVILDPFLGSGSTGVAAITEGFSIIGIEQDAEYVAIARRRCEHALGSAQGNSPLFAALSEGAA